MTFEVAAAGKAVNRQSRTRHRGVRVGGCLSQKVMEGSRAHHVIRGPSEMREWARWLSGVGVEGNRSRQRHSKRHHCVPGAQGPGTNSVAFPFLPAFLLEFIFEVQPCQYPCISGARKSHILVITDRAPCTRS